MDANTYAMNVTMASETLPLETGARLRSMADQFLSGRGDGKWEAFDQMEELVQKTLESSVEFRARLGWLEKQSEREMDACLSIC